MDTGGVDDPVAVVGGFEAIVGEEYSRREA